MALSGAVFVSDCGRWRPGSESNRRTRLCRPLHNHSATWPMAGTECLMQSVSLNEMTSETRGHSQKNGAGNETRTRDPDLGKVVLYQLSYSRSRAAQYRAADLLVNSFLKPAG